MVVLTKRKITGFKDYVENVDKMTEEVRCLYPFLVVLCVPSHPVSFFTLTVLFRSIFCRNTKNIC